MHCCIRCALVVLCICFYDVTVYSMGSYSPPDSVVSDFSEPAWTDDDIDALVTMEEVQIHSPHNTTAGELPDEFQFIHCLRFALNSSTPETADAVIVLMPGVLAGGNTFYYMGRQLVYMAHEFSNLSIEVWVPERRTNNLEDLTGLNAAESEKDVQIALDYYFNNQAIDGKVFKGFLTDESAPYIADIGLGMVMDDVYTLITTIVPDPVERRKKVFVGGHSLGGIMTAFFTGWDFDGDPATTDDAGYNNCAGLIALDTLIDDFKALIDPIFGNYKCGPVLLSKVATSMYPDLVAKLRDGSLAPIFPLSGIGFSAETFMCIELMAMLASWNPDEESTFIHSFEQSETVDKALKFMHSKNLIQYLYPDVSIKRYRYTNSALFGIMLDDNFMPFAINQFSMGFLGGGNVVEKRFPLPSGMPDSAISYIIEMLLTGDNLFIAEDRGAYLRGRATPLYTWIDYNEIRDNEEHPEFPSPVDEVTDLHDAAELTYKGPTNLIDWYFATRLMLDNAVAYDFTSYDFNLLYYHKDAHKRLPQFVRLAKDGTFLGPVLAAGYTPLPEEICEGYNHMDVVSAAANRPQLRENEVFMPLIEFVDGIIHP